MGGHHWSTGHIILQEHPVILGKPCFVFFCFRRDPYKVCLQANKSCGIVEMIDKMLCCYKICIMMLSLKHRFSSVDSVVPTFDVVILSSCLNTLQFFWVQVLLLIPFCSMYLQNFSTFPLHVRLIELNRFSIFSGGNKCSGCLHLVLS
jgi:hypothetical protein